MEGSSHRGRSLRLKGVIVGAVAILGLSTLYFGSGAGPETPQKNATASFRPSAENQSRKPVRAMNLALGNMVFLAQEIGFSVKGTKESAVDASKIAIRIESQLHGLRELYRQESAKNPALVGSLTMQFNISAAGEVSQAKEIFSRINDTEFKKDVMAEVGKWTFAELVTENVTVQCPLLFVQEGMDITTLIRWEKSLGNLADKSMVARATGNNDANQQAKKTELAAPAAPLDKSAATGTKISPSPAAKSDNKEFQIKYATSLRKDPNFSSTSLATFTIGTKVTMINKNGDWLEVRASENGPTGFIRKEFVAPVNVVRR